MIFILKAVLIVVVMLAVPFLNLLTSLFATAFLVRVARNIMRPFKAPGPYPRRRPALASRHAGT